MLTQLDFRSEVMRLYRLTVPKDEAWNVLNNFGDFGDAQFLDLNKEESPYDLPYTTQIKQCEALEPKLDMLISQCKKFYLRVRPPKDVDEFIEHIKRFKEKRQKAINLLLDEVQAIIRDQASFINE